MNTTSPLIAGPPHAATWSDRPIVRAVHAEYTKLRTIRSNWTIVLGSIVAAVALGALNNLSAMSNWDHMDGAERAVFDPTSNALVGVLFSALVLGAMAVRVITTEHSTGMLRTTFGATPRRTRVIAAKALVVVAVTFLAAITADVASLLVATPILDDRTDVVSPGSPGAMRAALLGAIAVSAMGLVGLALGAIVRRASFANIVLALAVVGGQLVGAALPTRAQRFLPMNELRAAVSVKAAPELLTPGAAIAILVAEALALVLIAAHVIRRRDV